VILLLDHDDSFVHTLASYLEELGEHTRVVRANTVDAEDIAAMAPTHIILSPGPRTPADCPLAIEVVHRFGPQLPILGVCLGHQCIAAAYGAVVARTPHRRHGASSLIEHDGRGAFRALPPRFSAARYHSLAVVASTLPTELILTAQADDGDVMGVRHREYPVEGIQFHPESVLTECGHQLLGNFIAQRAAPSRAAMTTQLVQ
jgi:anthranilate synthase/aminodeoxychorismate synthase-like glutamine amidotransferase